MGIFFCYNNNHFFIGAFVMAKVKLTVQDQITDMKSKGITFLLCSETDAVKFLANNTYYFKLKSYEKNYSNDNRDHLYRGLDFEYLKELSKIDMYLRRYILDMCLDIEHVLKTRLIHDCTTNPDTDGFDIVCSFLNLNYPVEKAIRDKAIKKSACSRLAANYVDANGNLKPIPLWIIVELISFGEFIDLYTYYYQQYHRTNDYSRYLGSIRFLRNASAHSNCLINSLQKQPDFSKTREVMQTISRAKHIKEQTRNHKMSVPVIHDFVTLLLVYNDLLNNPYNMSMRNNRMDEIRRFFLASDGRLKSKASYFSGNSTLREAYQFVCDVLKFIDNEYMKHSKRLLKTN